MSELIHKLEEILKRYISEDEALSLDLSDDDCIFRKFYFDKIPPDAAKEALLLYPNGEVLYRKYLAIINGFKDNLKISDSDLCGLVREHLQVVVSIMDEDEDEDAIDFIQSITEVSAADSDEHFKPGQNLLHKYVYGAVGEFLLNELPDDDSLWLLYDWSLEKTKWITVSAYFLEGFLDDTLLSKSDFFKPGFELWASNNNNRYWSEGNTFKTNNVKCKAEP